MSIRLWVTALLLAGAAPRSTVTAQDEFESSLPEDTLFFLSVDHPRDLLTAFQATSWGQMFADSELASARDGLQKVLNQFVADAREHLGFDPTEILQMVEGSVALCVLDLFDPEVTASLDPDNTNPAVARLADVGQQGEGLLAHIDQLFESLVEEGRFIQSTEELFGTDVTVLSEASEQHDSVLRYGILGTTYVMTSSSGELEAKQYHAQLLEGLSSNVEDSLQQNEEFQVSLAAQEERGVRVFLNLGGLIQRLVEIRTREDEEFADFATELGLRGLSAASGLLSFEDSALRLRLDCGFSGQGMIQGLLQTLCKPGKFHSVAVTPPDILSLAALRLDLEAGLTQLIQLLGDDGLQPADEEQMQEFLGFHWRNDLLPLLEGEFSFQVGTVAPEEALPGTEDSPTNWCVLLSLKDGPGFRTLLDGVLRKRGMHVARRKQEFLGFDVYVVPVFPPFSVIYAVLEDLVVLSMSPTMVQDVLRRKANPDLPALGNSEGFQEALKILPEDGVVLTANNQATVAQQLVTVLTLLPQFLESDVEDLADLVSSDGEIVLPELPDRGLMEKYFPKPSVGLLRVTEDGVFFDSIHP
jgi:hypothetical protein